MASEESIRAFRSDGAVLLKGVLLEEEVTMLAQGIEENLASLSPLALIASSEDDPGRFVEDFCSWNRISAYERIMKHSMLPLIASQLMQSETVRLYHDHMLTKEAGTRQKTPWHQDQPYYNVSGNDTISFWIPVDSVPLASTLKFIKGSHKFPWYLPRTFKDGIAKWFSEEIGMPELPADIDERGEEYEQIAWPVEPRDVVAFHFLTLHASNGSEARRRVFSARYVGDDVRHAARPWRCSPPYEGLADRLGDGQALEDDLFPIVWPPAAI